jgi:hypothetical protein
MNHLWQINEEESLVHRSSHVFPKVLLTVVTLRNAKSSNADTSFLGFKKHKANFSQTISSNIMSDALTQA